MIVLGIDLETTGLDTETCNIVEIGMCRYDTNTKRLFNAGSVLLFAEDYVFGVEAMAVNGLTTDFLYNHGISPIAGLQALANHMNSVDYMCAHNVQFDKKVLESQYKKYDMVMPDKTWVDTRTDLPYTKNQTSKKLVHLAADVGILNPFPHSALFDVATMLQLLSHYDIEDVLKRALSLNIKVTMAVPFEDNDHARSRRYYFDRPTKTWCKDIKEFELEEEIKQSKYPIKVCTD